MTSSAAHREGLLDAFVRSQGWRRELSGAERAAIELVRDPARSSRQIAAIVGCSEAEARWARRILGSALRPRQQASDLWKPPATGRVLSIVWGSEPTIMPSQQARAKPRQPEPEPEPSPQPQPERKLTGMPAINAAKTHCKRGHELVGDNLRMVPGRGGRLFRRCVACLRVRSARYQRNRRARLKAQREAAA